MLELKLRLCLLLLSVIFTSQNFFSINSIEHDLETCFSFFQPHITSTWAVSGDKIFHVECLL